MPFLVSNSRATRFANQAIVDWKIEKLFTTDFNLGSASWRRAPCFEIHSLDSKDGVLFMKMLIAALMLLSATAHARLAMRM